jgi:tetratricopeptide (TPR) repeat protein
MASGRKRLWSIVLAFLAIGLGTIVIYQIVRAAPIRISEGLKHYEAGRYEQAERAFEEAVELDPDNARGWYELGRCKLQDGFSPEALNCFEKAVDLEPPANKPWVHELFGYYARGLQWSGRPAEAETVWREALDKLPKRSTHRLEYQVNLARSIALQGDEKTNRAIEMLRSLADETGEPRVRLALAEVLAWAGRFDASAEQYQQALSQPAED